MCERDRRSNGRLGMLGAAIHRVNKETHTQVEGGRGEDAGLGFVVN
jgi:hypothetical protein